jgi:hypothetical protein
MTTETLETAAPTQPQITDPFEEAALWGVEISAGDDAELGQFLRWAYTLARPFDEHFLMEVGAVLRNMEGCLATPDRLAEGRGVLSMLDMLVGLANQERARLTAMFETYTTHLKQLAGTYTEEQADQWLAQNMPAVYARISYHRQLAATTSQNTLELEGQAEEEETAGAAGPS